MLQVEFPPAWQILPVSDASGAVARLLDELDESSGDTKLGTAAAAYFSTLVPLLHKAGVDVLASLVVGPDDEVAAEPPVSGRGFAMAMATVTHHEIEESGAEDLSGRLTALAQPSSRPAIETSTSRFDSPGGTAIRISTFRQATELADVDGLSPFVLDVRYAIPAGDGVAVVLSFETPTLVYLDELSGLFDAIARTVRVSGGPAAGPEPAPAPSAV